MRKFVINSKDVRTNAAKAVMEIRGEDKMEVLIRKHKSDKSAEQRNFWHFLLKIISDETGYTQEEVKELVKKKLLGTKVVKIGNTEKEVTESTESQDKIGYSELIDGTYVLAAEAGIVLPNPRYRE